MTDRLSMFAVTVKNLSGKEAETHDVIRFTLSGVRDIAEDIEALETENTRLKQWVSDLQDGTFVNCVYCGHRYGKVGEVPESMAEILKAHVEVCPQHPMSRLKVENARLKEALRECATVLEGFTCPECAPTSAVCRAIDGKPCEIVMLPRKAREALGEGQGEGLLKELGADRWEGRVS